MSAVDLPNSPFTHCAIQGSGRMVSSVMALNAMVPPSWMARQIADKSADKAEQKKKHEPQAMSMLALKLALDAQQELRIARSALQRCFKILSTDLIIKEGTNAGQSYSLAAKSPQKGEKMGYPPHAQICVRVGQV